MLCCQCCVVSAMLSMLCCQCCVVSAVLSVLCCQCCVVRAVLSAVFLKPSYGAPMATIKPKWQPLAIAGCHFWQPLNILKIENILNVKCSKIYFTKITITRHQKHCNSADKVTCHLKIKFQMS